MKVVGTMRNRVVVGVPMRPVNARTLAWAVGEAAETGSELVVVRADVNDPEVWGAAARNSLQTLEIVIAAWPGPRPRPGRASASSASRSWWTGIRRPNC